MWRFYRQSIRRMPSIALEALKRVNTVQGLLTTGIWIAIGGAAAAAWWQELPWQVPVAAFVVFSGYGFLRAVYHEHLQVEQERNALKKERVTPKKRKAINDLLGSALEEGLSLKQGKTYAREDEDQNRDDDELLDEHLARYEGEIRVWVDRTYDLIHDAFGKAEAQRFISNEGFSEEELFGRELPRFMYRTPTQRKYSIPARLKRLDKIIDRVNSLEISPGFNPQDWAEGTYAQPPGGGLSS